MIAKVKKEISAVKRYKFRSVKARLTLNEEDKRLI